MDITGDTDWTFAGMSDAELVLRRDRLHRDMFTEYVAGSRSEMRRAIVRINSALLDRRGFVYGAGETYRTIEDGWLMVLPGRHWASWLSCHGSGRTLGGSGVTYTGTLTDGTVVARTYDGHEYVWLGLP